jgi:hypothetical protein
MAPRRTLRSVTRMTTATEPLTIHVLPLASGAWKVRVADDETTATEHPNASIAERQARRRADALGIELVLIHDRYQRTRAARR